MTTFLELENKKRLIFKNIENADAVQIDWPTHSGFFKMEKVVLNWSTVTHHDGFLFIICDGVKEDFTEEQVEGARVEENTIKFLPDTEAEVAIHLFSLTANKIII